LSRLGNRLASLENRKGKGFAILIVDTFGEGSSNIREALVDGIMQARRDDESQEDFLRRVNPQSRPTVELEADCKDL
jgi:hypothetical protein